MRLLFDQNLSPDLPQLLDDLFPDSLHVSAVELDAIEDGIVWEYAKSHGFVVATKDKDYRDLSRTLGPPPKVILMTSGNGPTSDVEALLRERFADVVALFQDDGRGLLELP
jgi:predicted nuclease of predicted toxin-antitoxin system